MRTRPFILALLVAASLAACSRPPLAKKAWTELIARAESAPPNDRPALYLKIAR